MRWLDGVAISYCTQNQRADFDEKCEYQCEDFNDFSMINGQFMESSMGNEVWYLTEVSLKLVNGIGHNVHGQLMERSWTAHGKFMEITVVKKIGDMKVTILMKIV